MARNSLLPAPYIAGRFHQVSNADKLVRISTFVLFVIMPLAYMSAVKIGLDFEGVFLGVWLLTGAITLYAETKVKPQVRLRPFHYFSLALVLIALPGLFVSKPTTFNLIYIIGFIGVIVIKMFVVVIVLPRCLYESRVSPVQVVTRGLLTGAFLTCFITNLFYLSRGFHIFKSTRADFDDWLHPNVGAIYGSVCVLAAIIDPRTPKWIKFLAIGTGVYTMLVTQGRSALFSTIAVVLFLFGLDFIHEPKKYAIRGTAYLVGILMVVALFGTKLASLPAIQNIIERTATSDPLAGRLNYIELGIETWNKSQIVGYGLRGSFSVDNFWISNLMLFGVIGVLVFVIYYSACAVRGYKLYTSSNPELKLLGKFILMLCASFFIRSFTEDSHFLQLSNLIGNSLLIAVGLAYFVNPNSDRWAVKHSPNPKGPVAPTVALGTDKT